MKSIEEINGMFWHSVAAHLHQAMSRKWLSVPGISKASGVPEKLIEVMLSGVPSKREPKISDIIAVMAVFKIAPSIEVFMTDDIYVEDVSQPNERQLSILDMFGLTSEPSEDRDD